MPAWPQNLNAPPPAKRDSKLNWRTSARIVTLPGSMWSVGGKVFHSKADAEQAAARLDAGKD